MIDGALERVRAAEGALLAAGPTPWPLPLGDLEPVVVGAVLALRDGDWWVPGQRERVGAVLRDVPVERLIDGLQGARPWRVAPGDLSPALRALYAVGLWLAHPEAGVVVHLGSGSLADGALHEAVNLASLRGARVVFVVAERDLTGAPVPPQSAADAPAVAAAFGVPTLTVDGRDAAAVQQAVGASLAGTGPSVVAARLPARTP